MNIFVYILILITISNFVMVILGSNVENFALKGLASLGVPAGPDAPRIDMTSAEGSGGVKQAPPMVEVPVKNETRQEIVLNLCRNSRDFLENNLEFCKTV